MRACGPSTSVGWRLTALRLTTIEECSIPIEIGKLSAIGYRPSAISQPSAVPMHDFHAITGFSKVFAHIFGDHD